MKKTLFLLTSLAAAQLNAFDVVRDGEPVASLYYPQELPKVVLSAIEAFHGDLKCLAGTTIPDNDKSMRNRIELIHEKTTVDKDDVVEFSFPSPTVMSVRGGTHGLVRALSLLLEKFGGVVFCFPTEKGAHYPKTRSLVIPEEPFKHEAFFTLNRTYTWNWSSWITKLGFKRGVDCQHDLSKYVYPIKKYIQNGDWPAPEVFFMAANGERFDMKSRHAELHDSFQSDWQPCHTSRESINEAVKNINAYLDENPDATFISLSPNDHKGYCHCPECAKLNERGTVPPRRFPRYEDFSHSYYHWCNEVATLVAQKHPDIFFGAIAYREVHFAPDFKLHPKLVVYLCFDIGTLSYPEVDKLNTEWIKAWKGTGATLGIWDYAFGDSAYTLPRVQLKTQARAMKLLGDYGFRGYSGEGCTSLSEGPRRYLYMRQMENPCLDMDKEADAWYIACVGKEAAPYLRQYYDFWEKFWAEQASKTDFKESSIVHYHTFVPFGPYMYGLNPGDMEQCRALMENMKRAADVAGDSSQKTRADWLMKAFEYCETSALACFAEILEPSGLVGSREMAVKLLQDVPRAKAATEKRTELMGKMSTDPDLHWWWGMRRRAAKKSESDAPDFYETAITKVASFADDPGVRLELTKIIKDSSLPLLVRYMANAMIKTTTEKEDNLLLTLPEFKELATSGATVKLPVPNGEWLHDIPAGPGLYLARVKVAVPADAENGDNAFINLRLQGRNADKKPRGNFLDTPKLKPEAGKTYFLTNTIFLPDNTTYLQFIVNLFHFEPGLEVVMSDMTVIKLNSQRPGGR